MEENKNIEPEQPAENIPATVPGGEEIISSEQTIIEPTELQTNNMETHADHLHKVPGHGWKHYFFEFLMLFLAITLGFFVENMREHYVENKREAEYVKSLYDDLKSDSLTIASTFKEKEWALAKLDSLKIILDSSTISQNNELVYYFERFLTKNDVFTAQDVTYRQLLSSGNFRYFKNMNLYKKISGYYNFYDRYYVLGEGEFGNPATLHELESKLFDGTDLTSLYDPNASNFYTLFRRPQGKFKPVNQDGHNINQLKIRTGNTYYSVKVSKWFLGGLNRLATELIKELKKEYHLE